MNNKLMLTAAVAMLANMPAPEAKAPQENFTPDDLTPPPLPEGCDRDPRQNPQVGDILHVRVLMGAKRPKPMHVIDVTPNNVYWKRGKERCKTETRLWKTTWIIQHAEILAVST